MMNTEIKYYKCNKHNRYYPINKICPECDLEIQREQLKMSCLYRFKVDSHIKDNKIVVDIRELLSGTYRNYHRMIIDLENKEVIKRLRELGYIKFNIIKNIDWDRPAKEIPELRKLFNIENELDIPFVNKKIHELRKKTVNALNKKFNKL